MAKLTRITGRGAPFTVSEQYAPRFQALFDDPAWGDYGFDAGQSGGYNPRNIAGTNTPSQHSYGNAVDINWTRNARGTPGDIDPTMARTLAAKHGFKWGGEWKNPDAMHWEIDPNWQAPQQTNVAQNGAINSQPFPPPMALGGPKPQDTPSMAGNGILSRKIDPQEELMGILGKQGQNSGWQALTQLGAGIAAGANQGWGPGIGLGLSGASDALQGGQNARMKGLGLLAEMQNDAKGPAPTELVRNYHEALKQGFKGDIMAFKKEWDNKAGANAFDQFGKEGTIIQGPDGRLYSVQYGGDGSRKVEPFEEGFAPSKGYTAVGDAVLNRGTGTLNETNLGPAIAGKSAQEAIGEAAGKATAAAPADIVAGQNALDLVNSIRTDPGKARGTGFTSLANVIPGTKGYDFANKVDQAKSGAFLSAIQQMRGMGALSDAEGRTATAAVTRMNTATSEEAFDAALNDYEKVIKQGMARAQGRIASAPQTLPGAIPGQSQGPSVSDAMKSKYGLE